MSTDYNGWSLREPYNRERAQFLVVLDGDLDLNGAYALPDQEGLDQFVREAVEDGTLHHVQAIFEVKDVTQATLDRFNSK